MTVKTGIPVNQSPLRAGFTYRERPEPQKSVPPRYAGTAQPSTDCADVASEVTRGITLSWRKVFGWQSGRPLTEFDKKL